MLELSFIIPLYNCELWISQCLDSIFAIAFDDNLYEVIVIDDGSTDNSLKIVYSYSNKHKNLQILKQHNCGASTARNRGLEVAKGKWIWFVDADDTIITESLNDESDLRLSMNYETSEMIVFNYQKQYCNHIVEIKDIISVSTLSGCEYLLQGKLYLWNRLFRYSLLKNIRFVEGTKNIEDFYFDICAILPLHHIACLPIIGYCYNQQNLSSTSRNNSKDNLRKLSEDTQTIYTHLLEDITHLQGRQKKTAVKLLNESAVGYIYSLFTRYDSKSLHNGITFLREHGLYPAKHTTNRKENLFLIVANHEWLLAIMQQILKIL